MPSPPDEKIKIAVVGLGKMGPSHFAMVSAHPRAETLACDASGFLADVPVMGQPGFLRQKTPTRW